LDRFSLEGKPEIVKWEQDFLSTLYSLVECEFSRSKLSIDNYCKLFSAATGWEIDAVEYMKVGERIWNLTRLFNIREGFTRSDDTLPTRFVNEPLPSGPAKGHRISSQDLDKMLDDYYSLRGWNELGTPSKDKLMELGLNEVGKQIEKEI
jgi:aldehyde:ferredoxin oxidoreductase